jgi:hypothetical protein
MTHARQFSHDPAATLIKSLLTTFERENTSADRDKLMYAVGLEINGVNTIASAISLVEQKLNVSRKELEKWKKAAENSDDFAGVRHDFEKNEIIYEKPDDMIERQLIRLNIQINRLSEILSLLKNMYHLLITPLSKEDVTQMAAQLYQFLYQSCCKGLDNTAEAAMRALCLKELSQLDCAQDIFTACQNKIEVNIHAHLIREDYQCQKNVYKNSHAHLMIDNSVSGQGIETLMLREGLRYYKMADDLKAVMPTPHTQRSNKI